MLAAFDRMEDTILSLDDLFAAGLLPSTAELLDRSALEAIRLYRPDLGLPDGEAVLFIEVEGTADHVASAARQVETIVRARASTTTLAEEEAAIQRLWSARGGLAAAAALAHPEKHRIFVGEDLAVPLTEIPRTIRTAREIAAELGIAVVFSRALRRRQCPLRDPHRPRGPG